MTLDSAYRKTRKTHSRGTRVLQPLATDVLEGTLYFVTDEGVIERSNGTIWESFSGSSGGSSAIVAPSGSPLAIDIEPDADIFFPPIRGLEITKGFWTPFDDSGAGLTFTNVVGEWRRIGDIVFVSWNLKYPITANTATAYIGGLPFTVSATIDSAFALGFVTVSVPIYIYVPPNATRIIPLTQSGGVNITNNQISNQWLDGAGFYFAKP